MSRIEEIMQQVAIELKFNEQDDAGFSLRNEFVDKVAKLYAEECIKASLEKASENGLISKDYNNLVNNKVITEKRFTSNNSPTYYYINKDSITQESNIILL